MIGPVRLVWLAAVAFALQPARAQSCAPEFAHPAIVALKRAQRLSETEANAARAEAAWLVTQDGFWVHSLKLGVMTNVPGPAIKAVTKITKSSGHVLVVFKEHPELGVLEVIPTRDTRALLTSGPAMKLDEWSHELDESGRWTPRGRVAGPIPGARGDGSILASRETRAGGTPTWRLSRPDGTRVGFLARDVVELNDGRRLVADDLGQVHELPPKGFALGVAAAAPETPVKGFFVAGRVALDQVLTTLPPEDEMSTATPSVAHVEHREFYGALVGPPVDGERWVLLLKLNRSGFIWPGESRRSQDIQLVNGWQVYARGGRWYTRGGEGPLDDDGGVPANGGSRGPAPAGAAEAVLKLEAVP